MWWKQPRCSHLISTVLKRAAFEIRLLFTLAKTLRGTDMSLPAPLFTSHSLYSRRSICVCAREYFLPHSRALLFLFHLFFYIKGISTSRTAAPERSPEVFELHLFTELCVLLGGWLEQHTQPSRAAASSSHSSRRPHRHYVKRTNKIIKWNVRPEKWARRWVLSVKRRRISIYFDFVSISSDFVPERSFLRNNEENFCKNNKQDAAVQTVFAKDGFPCLRFVDTDFFANGWKHKMFFFEKVLLQFVTQTDARHYTSFTQLAKWHKLDKNRKNRRFPNLKKQTHEIWFLKSRQTSSAAFFCLK